MEVAEGMAVGKEGDGKEGGVVCAAAAAAITAALLERARSSFSFPTSASAGADRALNSFSEKLSSADFSVVAISFKEGVCEVVSHSF